MTDYTCTGCGAEFSTNCDEDDIACIECGAKRCPHCAEWFGGR
jgi:DNA-directed RNA polymerase subunit RPC12/RpoP